MKEITIEDVLKKYIYKNIEGFGDGLTVAGAEAAMTEYASLNRQGWTRVEDGLPENLEWCNDSVLFLQKNGVIRLGTYDYEFEEWNEIGGGIYKDVTHWMPLPNKPSI